MFISVYDSFQTLGIFLPPPLWRSGYHLFPSLLFLFCYCTLHLENTVLVHTHPFASSLAIGAVQMAMVEKYLVASSHIINLLSTPQVRDSGFRSRKSATPGHQRPHTTHIIIISMSPSCSHHDDETNIYQRSKDTIFPPTPLPMICRGY